MNRNLLTLALLMILLGLGFNFYLLAFFGLLMLIPATLSARRPPMRPAPVQSKQEVRRITPPPMRQPEAPLSQVLPKEVVAAPAVVQSQNYSPPLFPSPMFPALTQLGTSVQPTKEAGPAKPAERDELVEVGTMLALMKLIFD